MRAIILSDSHGDVRACMRAIEAMSPCDMIIHLGDIQRDVDIIKKEYSDIPVFSVMGNNELFFCGKTEDVVQFGDYRLFALCFRLENPYPVGYVCECYCTYP